MHPTAGIPKISTAIEGLDEVTNGGFPKGWLVLIWRSAGCGKTLIRIQFLVKGIEENNEPGAFDDVDDQPIFREIVEETDNGRWSSAPEQSSRRRPLTIGGCGIWALVDLIMIIVGSFKDGQGRPLVRK